MVTEKQSVLYYKYCLADDRKFIGAYSMSMGPRQGSPRLEGGNWVKKDWETLLGKPPEKHWVTGWVNKIINTHELYKHVQKQAHSQTLCTLMNEWCTDIQKGQSLWVFFFNLRFRKCRTQKLEIPLEKSHLCSAASPPNKLFWERKAKPLEPPGILTLPFLLTAGTDQDSIKAE